MAITPDITPALILAGYQEGLFPWSTDPVGWFSPDPRAIVPLENVTLPRNLPKVARRRGFTTTYDQHFAAVMRGCQKAHRAEGEWISDAFIAAYTALHARGFAHSVEIWAENRLVGGLYGVQVGRMFAGESMFHLVPDASKFAFRETVEHLRAQGVALFDVQVINPFTRSLGAVEVPRGAFLRALEAQTRAMCVGHGEKWQKRT